METVTCLHGFSQSGESWDEIGTLVGGPYRWLKPDVTAPTFSAAESALLALWRREGVRRSHLVGYSQGGRLALWLGTRDPDRLRTLTVISAHAGLEGAARSRRRAEDEALARRIELAGVEWFAGWWAARPLFAGLAGRGPDFQERLRRARLRNDPKLLAEQLRNMGAGATQPFWDRLPAIDVPVLLVAGQRDRRYVAMAQRLQRTLPKSALEVVDGAGHAVHLERPTAFASLLAAHLASR